MCIKSTPDGVSRILNIEGNGNICLRYTVSNISNEYYMYLHNYTIKLEFVKNLS